MARPLGEVLEDTDVVRLLTKDPASFRFPCRPLVMVGAADWPPHVVITNRVDGSVAVSGAMGNMLQLFSESFNFTYSVIIPEDGLWGAALSNGTWSGMIGQVMKKEVDIALGPFGMTVSRTKVVDFTESFHIDDNKILSRNGEPGIDPWGFLYPLTESVWAAVGAALTVSWLVTMVLARCLGYATPCSWTGELFLQHLRVFFNQGLKRKVTQGWAGQAVLGSWVLVAAVVFWSYTVTLISLLAVRHIPQPIQTLRDLLDDPDVILYTGANTTVTEVISSMKDGELKEMYSLEKVGRLKYASLFPASKMRYGRHATFYTTLTQDVEIAYYFQRTKRCDFYISKEGFFGANTHSMIGQKDSLFTAAMNHKIRNLVQAGLYQYWLRQELPPNNCRYAPSTVTVREPLSLGSLQGLFVVFGTGLLLATAVFCVELYDSPNFRTGP